MSSTLAPCNKKKKHFLPSLGSRRRLHNMLEQQPADSGMANPLRCEPSPTYTPRPLAHWHYSPRRVRIACRTSAENGMPWWSSEAQRHHRGDGEPPARLTGYGRPAFVDPHVWTGIYSLVAGQHHPETCLQRPRRSYTPRLALRPRLHSAASNRPGSAATLDPESKSHPP